MDAKVVSGLAKVPGEPLAAKVTFDGDAFEALQRLQGKMGLESPEDVVVKAVEILLAAEDKEILVRSGTRSEVLQVWRRL